MAGEAVYKTSSASQSAVMGFSVAAGSMASASFMSITGGGASSYPIADFVLKCAFAASIAAVGKTVDIYRRDLWTEGSPDVPSASNSNQYVGSFNLKSDHGTTATIAIPAVAVPLGVAPTTEWFLYDNTGQNLSSNASVYMHPYTLGTAS